ncbi:response regulator transcription factor [Pseudonocardia sp.]
MGEPFWPISSASSTPADGSTPSNATVRPGNSPLPPRETEVLRILVRGRTNREIAAALGISVTTANFHVVSLIRKSPRSTAPS